MRPLGDSMRLRLAVVASCFVVASGFAGGVAGAAETTVTEVVEAGAAPEESAAAEPTAEEPDAASVEADDEAEPEQDTFVRGDSVGAEVDETGGGEVGEAEEAPEAKKKKSTRTPEAGEAGTGEENEEVEADQGDSTVVGSAATIGTLAVPVRLLPVYQACGSRYGIEWEVLAAINWVETGFGIDLGAEGGAEGWMQFMPATWRSYGVDGNGDGRRDADDPVDAICAAARYLAASGGEEEIEAAVFAYNHADWYVRKVMSVAKDYARFPQNTINALSAIAQYTTDPLAAGRKALAVADGTVRAVGRNSGGYYAVLEDAYGSRFVYSRLAEPKISSSGSSATLAQGEEVEAGEVLGSARSGAEIGLSVTPSGSERIESSSLLALWREGGAAASLGIESDLDGDAGAARALLLPADTLAASVLENERLTLPRCTRRAIRAGEVDRSVLAALAYLTARGLEPRLAASSCEEEGEFAVEIEADDSSAALTATLRSLEGAMRPQRLVAGQADDGAGAGTVLIDYEPPREARLVEGKAVAPANAPAAVQAMIAAANEISETPYVWGGGHGSWASSGYDCSGAVSYVLHAAGLLPTPLTSGSLASWGEEGAGSWVTIYANAGHTYAVIAGLRWDTAGNVSETGPRWHREASSAAGFSVRHPRGI